MNKNGVVHFEIPADDCKRAKNFYEKIFGWTIKEMQMPSDSSTGGEPYYAVYSTESDEKGTPKNKGAINGGIKKIFELYK